MDNNELDLRQELLDVLKERKAEFEAGGYTHFFYSRENSELKAAMKKCISFLESHAGEDRMIVKDRLEFLELYEDVRSKAEAYETKKKKILGKNPANSSEYLLKRLRAAEALQRVNVNDYFVPHAMTSINELEKMDPKTKLYNKKKVQDLAVRQVDAYLKSRPKKRPDVAEGEEEPERDPMDPLTEEEFHAFVSLDRDKILKYKNDADLCQKYPATRKKIDLALSAAKKMDFMRPQEITAMWETWKNKSIQKAEDLAGKYCQEHHIKFTESFKNRTRERQAVKADDMLKILQDPTKYRKKADELEQVGQYMDAKMNVFTSGQYVADDKKHKWSSRSLKEWRAEKIRCENEHDREGAVYARSMITIRELEDCGLGHMKDKPTTNVAYYQNIQEGANTSTKREMFGFKVGKLGFGGVTEVNANVGDPKSKTKLNVDFGKTAKLRVGKIGGKLHSKHKNNYLGVNATMGTATVRGSAGLSLYQNGEIKPGLFLNARAEAMGAKVTVKGKVGTENMSLKANVQGIAGMAGAYAGVNVGNYIYKDKEGKVHEELGVQLAAGTYAYGLVGKVGGTLNIFGLKISLTARGIVGGKGADVEVHATAHEVGFSLGAALGIGGGLTLNVNWKDAASKIKEKWKDSKLRKFIHKFKREKSAGHVPDGPEPVDSKMARRTKNASLKKDDKVKASAIPVV